MKYLYGLLVGLGIAYCVIFGDFSLTENSGSVKNKIYYDNIQYTDNVNFYGADGLKINYEGRLSNPGDYYELSFDVVNDSTTDMMISKCDYHQTDSYIEYQLSYSNGSAIKIGDVLKKGETRRLTYRVSYKNPIKSNGYEFDSSFYLGYEQVL